MWSPVPSNATGNCPHPRLRDLPSGSTPPWLTPEDSFWLPSLFIYVYMPCSALCPGPSGVVTEFSLSSRLLHGPQPRVSLEG